MKFIERNLNFIGILLLTVFAGAAAGLYWDVPGRIRQAVRAKEVAGQYTCPMHPQILRNSAGDCPECGMKLIASRPGEELAEAKPAKGCCSSKPAAPAPATAMSCPHLASMTNSAPAGCCPHE